MFTATAALANPENPVTASASGNFDAVADAAIREGTQPLAALIARAESERLYEDPMWRVLGHYKSGFFGGETSEVDGQDFFLSARGKSDPRAELRATLAAFLDSRALPPFGLTAQCRFAARQKWLRERLNVSADEIPVETCPTFNTYLEGMNAARLTVVFPSAHPNNPSSMYGHTLLRADTNRAGGSTNLLSYSVTYGAQMENVGSATQIWKGLFGGLDGRFSILPYYVKLREYAQLEDRDVWEYALNVPPEKIDMVLRHAWELAPTRFDYKFFTENCSYHLLSLLDAAAPEGNLQGKFPAWVIPVDTLKAMRANGLVDSVNYRPAYHTLIRERRGALSTNEESMAFAIARKNGDSKDIGAALPPERAAAVLDLTYDYLRYDRIREMHALDATLSPREREVLSARSRLGIVGGDAASPKPDVEPDQGHGTSRIGIGAATADGDASGVLSYRGTYHDLLDPPGGYLPNSQLEFVNLRLRLGESGDDVRLDQLTLLSIVSLEPRDAFFRNTSWALRLGADSAFRANGERDVFFTFRGGAGYSFAPGNPECLLAYGLAYGALDAGNEFDGEVRLGLGGRGGMLWRPIRGWTTQIEGEWLAGVAGDRGDTGSVSIAEAIAIGRNASVRASFAREVFLGDYANTGRIELFLYR